MIAGFTNQDKQILDVLTDGHSPMDHGIEHDKSLKKNRNRTEVEALFNKQFKFHSKQILVEREILSPESIKESKEAQTVLKQFTERIEFGSYKHFILGLFHEMEIAFPTVQNGAIIEYEQGLEKNFCQYCATKLLRMNLETMELKQATLLLNFERAVDICGYIFTNSGVFSAIQKDYYDSPVLYYISVMMDILFDFREYIFKR